MKINNMEIFFYMLRRRVGYKILYIYTIINKMKKYAYEKTWKENRSKIQCLC